METKQLAKSKPPRYEITNPYQMAKMAAVLKEHIKKNNLSVNIAGKDYVMIEGWQFAGGITGLLPRIVKVENVGTMKWLAQAEIVNRNKEVVATGFALCSKDEMKKKSFDEYAILSMAQTRAIGKAYRNLLGWVMKLSGFEATPAEEMSGKKESAPETPQDNKAAMLPANDYDKQRIKTVAKEIGYKISEKSLNELTKVEASRIYFKLMERKASNKK